MRLGSAMMPTAASFENKHAVDQSLTSNTRKQMQGQIEGSNVGSGRIGANSVIDDGSVSESSIDKNTQSMTLLGSTNLCGEHDGIKKQSPGDRLKRSRERNRIHARKTRQRKKEQMQTLQNRAEELKEQQINLKQSINEKNTASILVGLFSKGCGTDKRIEDPRIEELMRRPVDDIPDASKLPELPALILPGQHNSRKAKNAAALGKEQEVPNDGIDYDLLGKDRSKCTPAELDQIRRERNRMHAKRTRDRKRLFMEEMAEMCKRLESENRLLRTHLDSLNGVTSSTTHQEVPQACPTVVSPSLSSTPAPAQAGAQDSLDPQATASEHGVTFDQIKTLLDAAGAFAETSASAVSASTNESEGGSISSHDDHSACKRRRLNPSVEDVPSLVSPAGVPKSIMTSTTASFAV